MASPRSHNTLGTQLRLAAATALTIPLYMQAKGLIIGSKTTLHLPKSVPTTTTSIMAIYYDVEVQSHGGSDTVGHICGQMRGQLV